MPSRLRNPSLESRGGGGSVAGAVKFINPRSILVPSLKPYMLVNETSKTLEAGLNVGDYWPFHEGGYRVCQAKEDLQPGRATFWAGSEEGRGSAVAGTKTILPVKRGDRTVTVETTAAFAEDDFSGGYFRVTGGLSTVAGRYYTIAHNDASFQSNEISGDTVNTRYVTKITLMDYIDTSLDQDTDWHIQSNLFSCQRHSPSSGNADLPRFTVGIPRVAVKKDEYFWCQVSGSAVGQLAHPIAANTIKDNLVGLIPYIGNESATASEYADLGKLASITSDAVYPSYFARLIIRSQSPFLADAYVPVWLYGNAGM